MCARSHMFERIFVRACGEIVVKNERVDKAICSAIAIVFCLLFPSCTKHQSSLQKNNVDSVLINNQKDILDTIIQQEAMLVDIPIPLYDERIIPSFGSKIESDTLVFGYKSPLACAQAQEFFMNQMERYGWQHLVSFESAELLLQFASPDRYCTMIIKDDAQNKSTIYIYVKKASI
jgi:hypothetical protein